MNSFKEYIKRIPDAVFVFFIFFIFFVFNLTSNFSGPHDSMGYLNDLEKGRDLFPAHHLLYHYTTFQILHFLSFLLPHVKHYYLIETIDAFWGCLGLSVVYKIFNQRLLMNRRESFLGTAVVAFSFGMWFYCSNIEVYMPPLFFLLCCLYVCTKKNLESSDVVRLAVVHAFSILFHQSNVLFTPIIIYKIWASRKQLPLVKSFLKYAILSASTVVIVFFIAGWILDGHDTVPEFYKWLRGYTLESNYWFAFGFNTFLKALVGFGHTFFGGHYIFRVRFLESIMQRLFFYHSLDDEAYLVRNLSYQVALFLLILTVLLCIVIVILTFRIIFNFRKLIREWGNVMIPLLMFLIIYSCFFYFWMPENLEFWIPQCAVFWILLLGMSKQLKTRRWPGKFRYLQAGIVILLFVINYAGSIYWMKDINNDSVYVKIKNVAAVSTSKDVILLQDPWLLEDFLEQYSSARVMRIPEEYLMIRNLDDTVMKSLLGGGKIFLYTEGNSMHASRNKSYMDSLLKSGAGNVSDFENRLTPVKIMTK
jgi:hypothetical protein